MGSNATALASLTDLARSVGTCGAPWYLKLCFGDVLEVHHPLTMTHVPARAIKYRQGADGRLFLIVHVPSLSLDHLIDLSKQVPPLPIKQVVASLSENSDAFCPVSEPDLWDVAAPPMLHGLRLRKERELAVRRVPVIVCVSPDGLGESVVVPHDTADSDHMDIMLGAEKRPTVLENLEVAGTVAIQQQHDIPQAQQLGAAVAVEPAVASRSDGVIIAGAKSSETKLPGKDGAAIEPTTSSVTADGTLNTQKTPEIVGANESSFNPEIRDQDSNNVFAPRDTCEKQALGTPRIDHCDTGIAKQALALEVEQESVASEMKISSATGMRYGDGDMDEMMEDAPPCLVAARKSDLTSSRLHQVEQSMPHLPTPPAQPPAQASMIEEIEDQLIDILGESPTHPTSSISLPTTSTVDNGTHIASTAQSQDLTTIPSHHAQIISLLPNRDPDDLLTFDKNIDLDEEFENQNRQNLMRELQEKQSQSQQREVSQVSQLAAQPQTGVPTIPMVQNKSTIPPMSSSISSNQFRPSSNSVLLTQATMPPSPSSPSPPPSSNEKLNTSGSISSDPKKIIFSAAMPPVSASSNAISINLQQIPAKASQPIPPEQLPTSVIMMAAVASVAAASASAPPAPSRELLGSSKIKPSPATSAVSSNTLRPPMPAPQNQKIAQSYLHHQQSQQSQNQRQQNLNYQAQATIPTQHHAPAVSSVQRQLTQSQPFALAAPFSKPLYQQLPVPPASLLPQPSTHQTIPKKRHGTTMRGSSIASHASTSPAPPAPPAMAGPLTKESSPAVQSQIIATTSSVVRTPTVESNKPITLPNTAVLKPTELVSTQVITPTSPKDPLQVPRSSGAVQKPPVAERADEEEEDVDIMGLDDEDKPLAQALPPSSSALSQPSLKSVATAPVLATARVEPATATPVPIAMPLRYLDEEEDVVDDEEDLQTRKKRITERLAVVSEPENPARSSSGTSSQLASSSTLSHPITVFANPSSDSTRATHSTPKKALIPDSRNVIMTAYSDAKVAKLGVGRGRRKTIAAVSGATVKAAEDSVTNQVHVVVKDTPSLPRHRPGDAGSPWQFNLVYGTEVEVYNSQYEQWYLARVLYYHLREDSCRLKVHYVGFNKRFDEALDLWTGKGPTVIRQSTNDPLVRERMGPKIEEPKEWDPDRLEKGQKLYGLTQNMIVDAVAKRVIIKRSL